MRNAGWARMFACELVDSAVKSVESCGVATAGSSYGRRGARSPNELTSSSSSTRRTRSARMTTSRSLARGRKARPPRDKQRRRSARNNKLKQKEQRRAVPRRMMMRRTSRSGNRTPASPRRRRRRRLRREARRRPSVVRTASPSYSREWLEACLPQQSKQLTEKVCESTSSGREIGIGTGRTWRSGSKRSKAGPGTRTKAMEALTATRTCLVQMTLMMRRL